jgi:hypothetical protein
LLNDIALRVQQTLIALDVYQKQLESVGNSLPGLQVTGYGMDELPVWWGTPKNPESMKEFSKRSTSFILLSALNMHLYLIDDYMLMLARKYYDLEIDLKDSGWFTPEVFQLTTGLDLDKLPFSETIEELRKTCKKLRNVKKTYSITAMEYFDIYTKICEYVRALSSEAHKRHFENLKREKMNEQLGLEDKKRKELPLPPPPRKDDNGDEGEQYGEGLEDD